jgi:hypothetical protein
MNWYLSFKIKLNESKEKELYKEIVREKLETFLDSPERRKKETDSKQKHKALYF